jgi:ABC-type multidrug transport system fused ATPase/permease subunit
MERYGHLLAVLLTGYVLEPLLARIYMRNLVALGEKCLAAVRQELFRTLLMQRLAFYDAHPAAELQAAVGTELDALRAFVFNNCSRDRGLRAFAEALGAVAVLFVLSWRLAPVCTAVIVAAALAAAAYRARTRAVEQALGVALRRMSGVALQAFDGIRTVRSFGGEALERERFQQQVAASYDAGLALGAAKADLEATNRLAIHAALLALYGWGGWLVAGGHLPVGALVTGIGFTFSLTYAVQGSIATLAELRRASGSLDRVRELVQAGGDPDPSMYAALPPGAWWDVANGDVDAAEAQPGVEAAGAVGGDAATVAAVSANGTTAAAPAAASGRRQPTPPPGKAAAAFSAAERAEAAAAASAAAAEAAASAAASREGSPGASMDEEEAEGRSSSAVVVEAAAAALAQTTTADSQRPPSSALFAPRPRVYAPIPGDDAACAAARRGGELELRGVNFAYPSRSDASVLRDVSIKLRRGSVTALVGRSGAGKSTVAALLSRFYEPQGGQVLLGGVPAQCYSRAAWTRAVSLVSQEPVLFSGTIGENIAYGKPHGRATFEEVRAAAVAANAHEFVERLPKGYDTVVGERGHLLSGGQRQRVAIARALLKDAPVLILDEATSALDRVSETLVQQAIRRLVRGRTVLVIAHRLSTVQEAAAVVVMEEGKVVESGSHQELMERGGKYAELMSSQGLILGAS